MKQKNEYCHRDNGVTVLCVMYKGEKYEVYIDTEDFSKVNGFNWSLCPQNKTGNIFRVRANKYLGNRKCTSLYMHRLIMDVPKDKEVDHINNNPLDNRKSNLRIVSRAENQQNKRSARKDNKSSGIRNVYYDNSLGKYKVTIRLNGKNKHIGVFENIEEAEKVAKETRKKYMPFSKEGTIHATL